MLTAGVFALLAMIYVPTPAKPYHAAHYRFVFSQDDTSVAFFQLLVNVVFAALLGALLAAIIPKLPRWAWRWITGIALIAFLIMGALAWRNFTEAAADWARSDEEFADSQLAYHYPDAAKLTLRNAARNWQLALRFDEATRVENRIKALQQHPGQGFTWADEAPQAPGQPGPRASPAIGSDFIPDPQPQDFGFVPDAPSQAPRASPASGNPFDQFDAAAPGSAAANPRAYRVTGLVLEVNDSMIAMQKGKDRWEIGRNSNTKVTGDLKVGAMVTITYTLTATGMEVKSVFNPDAMNASHGQRVPRPSPSPYDWQNDPVVIKAPTQAPQASSIPRARPVRSPSPGR